MFSILNTLVNVFQNRYILCAAALLCLTSCYQMPGPDDFSTVPATNNPMYTREKPNQAPGVGY